MLSFVVFLRLSIIITNVIFCGLFKVEHRVKEIKELQQKVTNSI
jgi:hypothetical protein